MGLWPRESVLPDKVRHVTITTNDITLGFDPGGGNRFGCCILRPDRVQTKTVCSIGEAIGWTTAECSGDTPISAGIDTLLHWSDGSAGWRRADLLLKRTYPEAAKSVVAPNSLYGAMVVGGVGLAIRLRDRW